MSKSAYLVSFYEYLSSPTHQFEQKVKADLDGKLKRWQIMGGASVKERKDAIQESITALAVYSQWNASDAQQKTIAFKKVVTALWPGEPIPAPIGAAEIQKNMNKTEALYNILMAKFMLLDYWEGVATGKTEPQYPADGAHWALHEFLQFDPQKVRPILEIMLEDASSLLNKPWNASFEPWCGAQAKTSFVYTKDFMGRTIKAEAGAKVGASVDGKFEVDYKGLTMVAKAELFAGARAGATGEIKHTATSIEAKGEIEVEIGIRIKADVQFDITDALELKLEGDAFAGAMAKAEAEIYIAATGVKLKASAEAFAGARIKGTASGKLKLGGREIATAKGEGTLTAGAGASAKCNFECSVFGKVGFGAGAEATAGLGAGAATEFSVDFHNINWGCTNLFWAWVNEKGFKNQGKVWLLPVEENDKLCLKARDILFKLMGDLYRENEEHLAGLSAWKVLETQVATAVTRNNPQVKALKQRG